MNIRRIGKMKKEWEAPVATVVELNVTDIICVSFGGFFKDLGEWS